MPTTGTIQLWLTNVASGRAGRTTSTVGLEADLLPGLAQRRLLVGLARVHPATGEADLAAMVAQVHRPPGEQHLGTVGAVGQQHEHRRRARVGEVGVPRSVVRQRRAPEPQRSAAERAGAGTGHGAGPPARQSAGRGMCCVRRGRRGSLGSGAPAAVDELLQHLGRDRRSSCWRARGRASVPALPLLPGGDELGEIGCGASNAMTRGYRGQLRRQDSSAVAPLGPAFTASTPPSRPRPGRDRSRGRSWPGRPSLPGRRGLLRRS